jgi:hypothetical protein
MRERDKNLAEQKIQQYHLAQEGGSVLCREEQLNLSLQLDRVLLRSSQRLSRLRYTEEIKMYGGGHGRAD